MILDVQDNRVRQPINITAQTRKRGRKQKPALPVTVTWTGLGRLLPGTRTPLLVPNTKRAIPRSTKRSNTQAAAPLPSVLPKPAIPQLNVLQKIWQGLLAVIAGQAGKKRMRVCESVSLGDKRFVAIVRVDSHNFLLGGSSASVSLLAKLSEADKFSTVLQQKADEVTLRS
jgi:Flagellar biosynthesis protein, FliO